VDRLARLADVDVKGLCNVLMFSDGQLGDVPVMKGAGHVQPWPL